MTYKYRVKDGNASTNRALRAQARAVNYVWNYCCQIDREAYSRWKNGSPIKRPTAFDLIKLCTGSSRELGLHSDCISAVCQKFANAREVAFPKTPRFRSYKRNLDWIPISTFTRTARFIDGVLTFHKRRFYVWHSRSLPENAKPKSWCFSTDSRGRWYVNITIKLPDVAPRVADRAVGIDLGLKSFATMSDGTKIEMPAFYRKSETKLARLQRFGLKTRARSIAAKVANQRRHFLHQTSTKIVRDFDRVVVGDVSPSQLGKTRMAKSVHDAGWAAFRSMLQYKSIATGASIQIVSERNTSRTCSCCGTIPDSSPKGMSALGIRHWTCSGCGCSHDRDVNAARNILRVGAERRPPVVEIP